MRRDGPLCDRWGAWGLRVGVEEERTEEERDGEEEEEGRWVGG